MSEKYRVTISFKCLFWIYVCVSWSIQWPPFVGRVARIIIKNICFSPIRQCCIPIFLERKTKWILVLWCVLSGFVRQFKIFVTDQLKYLSFYNTCLHVSCWPAGGQNFWMFSPYSVLCLFISIFGQFNKKGTFIY